MEELPLRSQECRIGRTPRRDLGDVVGDQALQEGLTVLAGDADEAPVFEKDVFVHGALPSVSAYSGGPNGGALQASRRRPISRRMPGSLLFVTSTRLGDAVLSTGVLSHCLDRLPGVRVTVAAGPVAAPIFRNTPASSGCMC